MLKFEKVYSFDTGCNETRPFFVAYLWKFGPLDTQSWQSGKSPDGALLIMITKLRLQHVHLDQRRALSAQSLRLLSSQPDNNLGVPSGFQQ